MGKGEGCGSSAMTKNPPTSDEVEVPAVVPPAPVDKPADPVVSVEPATPAVADKAEPKIDTETVHESEGKKEEALPEPVVVEEKAVAPEVKTDIPDGLKVDEEPLGVVEDDSPVAKIYIVYYSMYGHVGALAAKIKEAIDAVDGAEGHLFQVPETLPEAVLAKMGAPPKPRDIPVIQPKELVDGDAFLFGIPTRFGLMCAQMKSFFDATGSLWQSQALAAKPAGFFFSTATQAGGQETTALTAMSQLAHHGLMFVPIGYTNPSLFSHEVHGGSPYGAGTLSGDGTRFPSDLELDIAAHQGRQMAELAKKLLKGAAYI